MKSVHYPLIKAHGRLHAFLNFAPLGLLSHGGNEATSTYSQHGVLR